MPFSAISKMSKSQLVMGVLAVFLVYYIFTQLNSQSEMMTSHKKIDPNTFYHIDSKQKVQQPQDLPESECNPANFASVSLLPETNNVIRDKAFEFGPKQLENMDFTIGTLGENTQGSSLKNANLQLRSEPANKRIPVSPWMNSTIEPDLHRRSLE